MQVIPPEHGPSHHSPFCWVSPIKVKEEFLVKKPIEYLSKLNKKYFWVEPDHFFWTLIDGTSYRGFDLGKMFVVTFVATRDLQLSIGNAGSVE
jgi:hypothetical protein